MNVKKKEVEYLLGCRITDEQFEEALMHARRKQRYIFQRDRHPGVLQKRYLAMLVSECIKSCVLSRFTMEVCRESRNMEKEHSTKSQSAQTVNHIVSVPAS